VARVVILGGYGRLGRLCAQQLAELTSAQLVIAGPNIQRAESAALALGGRAAAAYGDAADPRTLARLLHDTDLLVACCSDLPPGCIDVAVGMRVPVVCVSSLDLGEARRQALAERAWRAGVPAIAHAGALPGTPGILAELAVRRFPHLEELRLASTGPWRGTPGAARDVLRTLPARRGIELPTRFDFGSPIGSLAVRSATTADLDGFAQAHCVDRVLYLEPLLGRRRLLRAASPGFALIAEARVRAGSAAPDARFELAAPDPLLPAAALCTALGAGILAHEIPAGLLTPREARNPLVLLGALEKRGVRVRV
jgi:hypothetical protein